MDRELVIEAIKYERDPTSSGEEEEEEPKEEEESLFYGPHLGTWTRSL